MTFNFSAPPATGVFGASNAPQQQQQFSFSAPPPATQTTGLNFTAGFGQQAQTAPANTTGLGGTSSSAVTTGNNADLSAGAATGSARLIEKPRDVQLPAELLAQFNALKLVCAPHMSVNVFAQGATTQTSGFARRAFLARQRRHTVGTRRLGH
jgi:hypothetical protein